MACSSVSLREAGFSSIRISVTSSLRAVPPRRGAPEQRVDGAAQHRLLLHPLAPCGKMWVEKGGDFVVRLTDDADYLLCALYEAYRQRRKDGKSIDDAKWFGGPESIQSDYCPLWPTDDIKEAACELHGAGLVNCLFSNNSFSELFLESAGISMMEHRFADKLDKLAEHIATLRKLL